MQSSATKVPPAHVAKIARAVVEQFGTENADAVTTKLGRTRAGHAAEQAHKTLRLHGLKAEVEIKYMQEPCNGMPVCYMSDYIRALQKRNQLSRLFAGLSEKEAMPVLASFWRKYQKLFPSLEVFELFDDPDHPAQPETTIPLDIHTDEGRGLKKTAVMIISSAPSLGIGTLKQKATRRLPEKHALNFAGQTQGNRMVHVVAPKETYEKNHVAYEGMCGHVALNSRLLLDQGFNHQNRTWCVAYLATLGDWPAHIKNGNLERSFLHGAKMASQSADKLSGICHICSAGIAGVPWEDVRLTAKSLLTIGLVEPWSRESPWLALIHYRGLRHACFPPDIWHGWSLGWGKECTASSVVRSLQYFPGNNIGERVENADKDLQSYCRRSKENLSFACLTQLKLGWDSQDAWPKGSWSKAEDTRIVLQWQIEWLRDNRAVWRGDAILALVLPAFEAIDSVFSALYSHGYYIPEAEGLQIAQDGLSFLGMMQDCINICMDGDGVQLNLFKMQPKMHMLFHAFAEMHFQCKRCGFCQNPLSQSCQLPEDLIGKTCRLSRRVDSRLVSQRTLDCHLICAGMSWMIPYLYEDD